MLPPQKKAFTVLCLSSTFLYVPFLEAAVKGEIEEGEEENAVSIVLEFDQLEEKTGTFWNLLF